MDGISRARISRVLTIAMSGYLEVPMSAELPLRCVLAPQLYHVQPYRCRRGLARSRYVAYAVAGPLRPTASRHFIEHDVPPADARMQFVSRPNIPYNGGFCFSPFAVKCSTNISRGFPNRLAQQSDVRSLLIRSRQILLHHHRYAVPRVIGGRRIMPPKKHESERELTKRPIKGGH